MILASSSGTPVPAIARLVAADEDTTPTRPSTPDATALAAQILRSSHAVP
jgi:hypothetical protein